MTLYGPTGGRKYLNAAERRRFAKCLSGEFLNHMNHL
jgi:hypothetical protein